MKNTDLATIHTLDRQWGEAATRKDLAAVVAFYAPDGALVWPGYKLVRGTAGIRKMWREMMKMDGLLLEFTAERVDFAASGDFAVDLGKVKFGQIVKGKRVSEIAKYVVIWKKVRGKWRVFYDCWNSNTGGIT